MKYIALHFKKLTLAVAIGAVFNVSTASAALLSEPAISGVPQGSSSVDVVLTGKSNQAGHWTGSINGEMVDNSFAFGQGYKLGNGNGVMALDKISVAMSGFNDGIDIVRAVNISDAKQEAQVELSLTNSSLKTAKEGNTSYSTNLINVSAKQNLKLSAKLNVKNVRTDNTQWVYGLLDNAKEFNRTYTCVTQNIEGLTGNVEGLAGGNFISTLLGGGNGLASIDKLDITMSGLELTSCYGLANTKGGLAQVGEYTINVSNSNVTSLYGFSSQANNGKFTLAGSYTFNPKIS